MDLYLNGLGYGIVAVGWVACGLCAHAWEVVARLNQSVMCYSCLSEGVFKLYSAMSQFDQTANIKFMCKVGNSAVEALQALQTDYGVNAL